MSGGALAYLRRVHDEFRGLDEGTVATYIPELGKADPDWFSIVVVTTEGDVFEVGDAAQRFTIQSISKPFMFGAALEAHGREAVARRVGVEPSGEAFNSIVLDEKSNRPYNPMVNAGAIATTALLPGATRPERGKAMLELFRRYAGRTLTVDAAVYASESATGHRNRAISYLMLNFGMVPDRIEEILELYFAQCSTLISCRDLAIMGACLANDGVNPVTGERAIQQEYVRDLLSVMYTCGLYDFSGEWAYHVGLPAKSGVAGGLLAVVPGRMAIAVFSPKLDARGNSVRGIAVCRRMAEDLGLHVFDRGTPAAIGRLMQFFR